MKLSLANIPKFANQASAVALEADLQQQNDKKRAMNGIDIVTVNQLFSLFRLKDPGCDKDNNGMIEKEELKCLNKIWKYYVPK
jgi:hypothetical protein